MSGVNAFWNEQVIKLKSHTAHLGEGFILSASMEEILAEAPEEFKMQNRSAQRVILAQTRASHLMPTPESGTPSVNEHWAEKAYPLKRISIVAQCTRHGTNGSLIERLEVALKLLKEGFANGCEHDDDFGYIFKTEGDLRASIFGEEPSGRRHQ